MERGSRKLKQLEIDVLNSTFSPEARKAFAEIIKRIPKRKLDPKIRKVILDTLKKKKSGKTEWLGKRW